MEIRCLVNDLREVQNQIEHIRSVEGATLAESILEKRNAIEQKLHRQLIDGGVIGDSVLDYCARNFANYSVGGNLGVLDSVKNVEGFQGYIKGAMGKLILAEGHQGFSPVGNFFELGIIAGEVDFNISRGFRNIYVPVKQVYVPEGGEFVERGSDDRVIVNSDFFGPRGEDKGEGHWKYSGSGSIVVGGNGVDDFCGNLHVGYKREIGKILNPASDGIKIKGAMSLPEGLK